MQINRQQYLPQRSRYYHSAMVIDSTNAGTDYRNLKRGYVIFICMFDYFQQGEAVYTIHMKTDENNLPFEDGQTTILVNMKCPEEKIPKNLRSFYSFVNHGEVSPEDEFICKIHERTERANQSREVYHFMTLDEEYRYDIQRLEKVTQQLEARKEQLETDKTRLEEAKNKLETDNTRLEEAVNTLETEQLAFHKLVALLLEENRTADLKRATEETPFREKLLKEFQIV